MKIFNKKLLSEYEYKPLQTTHEGQQNLFTIGDDGVEITVSATAGLGPQGDKPNMSPIPLSPMAQGQSCDNNCGCSSEANDSFPTDATGIQEMLVNMFMDVDPELNRKKAAALTEDLDLNRLENIIHLSKQGDGWDSDAARAALAANIKQLNPEVDRREAMKMIAASLLVGFTALQFGCTPGSASEASTSDLKWDEYFKGNFRLMSDEEKAQTVDRLERLYEEKTGKTVNISTDGPIHGVLYGYAFNISKCRGYMDCVRGCLAENNQDRASDMRYIRIHEHKQGQMNFDEAMENYNHEVPADGHYYIGTQCFHCENAPCIPVCPVKATWKEEDGIVVVDYDWCIGCRYCIAACPYDARRFNWADPVISAEEVNGNQHYLGNRLRKQGVTEKCTFCIQRTRKGRNPACVEACPTGARIFGNLLDPNSDIRWVLKNKKVFRLKEDLGTEPKFWYFMD